MNRAETIQHFRSRTGFPDRGTTGTDRILSVFNDAFRAMWADLPATYTREEMRFELEAPYSTGTLAAHSSDAWVLVLVDQPAGTIPSDGSVSARALEVLRSSTYITRRIREVFTAVYNGTARDHIVIDEPWDNTTDTGLTFRIWTDAYPIPGDVDDVHGDIILNPEVAAHMIPLPFDRKGFDRARYLDGWRLTGRPTRVARGPFYQLPAPHYTPTLSTIAQPAAAQKWGFDDAGVERRDTYLLGQQYEPAGTFQYRVCHGWGRRRWLHPTKGKGFLAPFYLSAPSGESAAQQTTWGGSGITVTTPNIDYVYGFGNDPTKASYGHAGIEKWLFRKRTATEDVGSASNHAAVKLVESDDVYYLMTVFDGGTTTVTDKGQIGPADRHYPLRDWHGHQHLVFDRIPTERQHVRLVVSRQPTHLDFDTDAAPIPPAYNDAFVELLCRELLGRRAGDNAKLEHYDARYRQEIAKTQANATQMGFESSIQLGAVLPGAERQGLNRFWLAPLRVI